MKQSYVAQPMSRDDIRARALLFRRTLGLEECLYVDVLVLLELVLTKIGLNYDIIDSSEMTEEALTLPEENLIKIREDVYNGAIQGVGRYRFTIMHEIGHFMLHSKSRIALARNTEKIEAYRDPEWQANAFAGEVLVPFYLTKNMTAEEISKQCGVTLSAAKTQKNKQKKIS